MASNSSTTTPPNTLEPDARERVAQGFQHMVDEADQLLRNAQRAGQVQFDNARDKLAEAREHLAHLEDTTMAQARRAAQATDQAVRAHPYAAMGVAAGVGLLLGMLIARR